jgi:hypothetical protein
MNYTTARCGHQVVAEGAPGSSARKACENRTCDSPRCESMLPAWFTDRECAAYVWMYAKTPWTVNLLDKTVKTGSGKRYANLIEFAKHHGWEG